MDARTVEQVKEWDSRPFSGGFSALHDLADAGFAGAVDAGGAWLFMLNGRVVGVFDGDVDDFESASGTAYEAPHSSLPLLTVMQERGGETQAKYYTNDTPLAEATDTLSDKKFTGYVELSENVLSGDYYVVFHGGRSMSVAFVGESEQLVAGDEAFERANDEVGIYEVMDVDVDVTEIPEPQTASGSDAGTAAAGTADESPTAQSQPEADSARSAADEAAGAAGAGTKAQSPESGTPSANAPTDATPTETPGGGGDDPSEAGATGAGGRQPQSDAQRGRSGSESPATGSAGSQPPAEGKGDDGAIADEQQWRETTAIPSLDPERSSERSRKSKSASGQPKKKRSTDQQRRSQRQPAQSSRSQTGGTADGRLKELKAELQSRSEKIEALAERLSAAEEERDDLRQERDDLREEVTQLREKLEAAKSAGGAAVDAERDLTPQQALDGTNLFVRYGSKGKGTLADAASGEAPRKDVNANLKLEHHTQFAADEVAVDGEAFESFLHGSMEYRFVDWLVSDLLYEIMDTGRERGMKDVFEAIPEIDRIELRGMVTAADEDGETYEESFDVVLRDRMGNPLVVANLNDSRDPATGEMLGSLVDAGSAVGQANDELSGAFQVTKSFFEPAALETTEDATSGGLLSRDKRESFVKLSRKRGYHLCLVESRDGEFHLNVPEL